MEGIRERFEIRPIWQEEAEEAAEIERLCFPPAEDLHPGNDGAEEPENAKLFLVAVEKETGKIAGFLNGLATGERVFRDAFFTDPGLYEPEGENVMLLGGRGIRTGLARELMSTYARREKEKGRKNLILTCLDGKVAMYQKMGFPGIGPLLPSGAVRFGMK